jgi:glutamyl-Q tRNA(Asp) synthetase
VGSGYLSRFTLAWAELAQTRFALGLTYHCSCTRGDIRAALAAPQESAQALFGPDGPVYPGTCRNSNLRPDQAPALRLNIARALEGLSSVSFTETGYQSGVRFCTAKDMIATLGDVVLARKDIGVSYHLAVVVDDGAQNITEVVRGLDLQPATAIHQLLQHHLGLPRPRYHHHHLIRDTAGKRLAKRDDARSLASFRAQGMACDDVLSALGLEKPL